jgi:hypothetical protein
MLARSLGKQFHKNELGMSSIQVVATIAVAATVMLGLTQVGRQGSDWMQRGYDDLAQKTSSIELGAVDANEPGTNKLAVPAVQKSEFQAFAHVKSPAIFRSTLFEDTPAHTQLAAATEMQDPLGRQAPGTPQRQQFDTPEHRRFGELAARKARINPNVKFGKDYEISFGEMVTMGDFFESEQQLWDFATKPGKGAGTREEVDYVRQVMIQGKKELKSRFSKEAIDAAENRFKWLAVGNHKHFAAPREEFADRPAINQPDSAGRTYLSHHAQAIGLAFAAGKQGQTLNSALRKESFGAHFLTDAVSAGHVRTPRTDVQEWWEKHDPGLNRKFQRFLGEKIAQELKRQGNYKLTPTALVKWGARRKIEKQLAKMPPVTMAGIVALGLHDFDNLNRLNVEVDGKQTVVAGDGYSKTLGPGKNSQQIKADTTRFATDAIDSGIQDLKKAYELGKTHPELSASEIIKRIQGPDGRYGFESFIPREDKTRTRPQPRWKVNTVDELLADPTMKLIIHDVIKEQVDVLADFGKTLEEPSRSALIGKGGVVDQIKRDPLGAFQSIVAYED